jgi:hypothetical protein
MRGAPRIDRGIDRGMMRAEGSFGELQLAQEHGAGLPQPDDDRCISIGAMILVDGHAGSRRNALGMTEILHGDRHAMQGSTKCAAGDLAIGTARLSQGQVRSEGSVTFQAGLEPGDAIKKCLSHLDRRKLARLDATADFDEVEVVEFIRGHD